MPAPEPVIENRRARHDYHVESELECGIQLTGSEVKSLRAGQASLQEGFVEAVAEPTSLRLHAVHINEYAAASVRRQHAPARVRALLAHRREIRKLAEQSSLKGMTLIPLKIYFVRGRAKVLIGVARGKKQFDKRADIAKREAGRDMERALRRRR